MSTVTYDLQANESPSESQSEGQSESQPLVSDDVSSYRRVRWLRTVGRWTNDNRLLILTVLSVLVGIVVGLCVRQAHPGRVAVELLSLPGELFLRMLKMLILPLIMFSLMAGLGSLDTKVAGALGWRTVLYYMTTTLIAVVLGLTLVMVIQPGGRGKVDKPCDNSTFSVQGHELETLDAILDLMR